LKLALNIGPIPGEIDARAGLATFSNSKWSFRLSVMLAKI
jgi:hypothetical protein